MDNHVTSQPDITSVDKAEGPAEFHRECECGLRVTHVCGLWANYPWANDLAGARFEYNELAFPCRAYLPYAISRACGELARLTQAHTHARSVDAILARRGQQ